MQWISAFAVFFIVWWTILFVVLPIGLRTQNDDGNVALGTVASAPARFRGGKIVLLTTLISLVVCATWYAVTWYFGFTMDDLPRIIPVYD
jgi:predicted secreted protein